MAVDPKYLKNITDDDESGGESGIGELDLGGLRDYLDGLGDKLKGNTEEFLKDHQKVLAELAGKTVNPLYLKGKDGKTAKTLSEVADIARDEQNEKLENDAKRNQPGSRPPFSPGPGR